MLRPVRTTIAWAPLLLSLSAVTVLGCTVETRTVPVDDATVYEQPPPPPPPQEVEVVPASPGVDYEYVPAYHRWDGHRYVWVRGRYERRPHEGARYERAHWEAHGRGHIWVEGRWR